MSYSRKNRELKRSNLKYCKDCDKTKSLDEFYFSRTRNTYDWRCKVCSRQDREQYRRSLPQDKREVLREKHNSQMRRRYEELRTDVVYNYGGKCICCGESAPIFLAIDHVYNNGKEDRKRHANHVAFYLWLQQKNYPDEYQILCHNCNWAKSHGGCPHQGF